MKVEHPAETGYPIFQKNVFIFLPEKLYFEYYDPQAVTASREMGSASRIAGIISLPKRGKSSL